MEGISSYQNLSHQNPLLFDSNRFAEWDVFCTPAALFFFPLCSRPRLFDLSSHAIAATLFTRRSFPRYTTFSFPFAEIFARLRKRMAKWIFVPDGGNSFRVSCAISTNISRVPIFIFPLRVISCNICRDLYLSYLVRFVIVAYIQKWLYRKWFVHLYT